MNVRVIPHKRDNSKWAVDYRCPVTKKRKYESFDTKREAVDRKKELEGKEAKGEYRPLHRRTWAEFRAEFESKLLPRKEPKTRGFYRDAIRAFERVACPTLMQTIDTRMIDEFATKRLHDPKRPNGKNKDAQPRVSIATVNATLRHIRAMLRVAHEWGFMPMLPRVRMLSEPEHEPRAIPVDVFEKILTEARGLDKRLKDKKRRLTPGTDLRSAAHNPPCSDWWVAYLSVAYLTGMRWNEILNLKWSDLRFAAKPEICIGNKKAGRIDYVPMAKTLEDRLKAWMNTNTADAIRDNRLVFPHLCHPRTLSATWEQLQKWAGIADPFRFHDMRVSFCTNLVAAGTEAATLKKLARHTSLATTLKYYRGRTDDADRRAIEKMEAGFSTLENATASE